MPFNFGDVGTLTVQASRMLAIFGAAVVLWVTEAIPLAATSIGAIWSSCSPDFGINGVMDRFGQIQPRVLFSADTIPGLDTPGPDEQVLVEDITKDVQSERQTTPQAVEEAAAEARWEMVFVNQNVPDYEQLTADLQGSEQLAPDADADLTRELHLLPPHAAEVPRARPPRAPLGDEWSADRVLALPP